MGQVVRANVPVCYYKFDIVGGNIDLSLANWIHDADNCHGRSIVCGTEATHIIG